MKKILLLFTVLIGFSSFGQEKNPPYPKLKQLKEKDLISEITPQSNKKDLWGYVNEKEDFIIKPVFDAAEPFRKDKSTANRILAMVSVGDKVGYLQRDALYFIPPVYDSLSGLEDGVVYFSLNGKKGFINLEGSVVTDDLDELEPFSNRDYAWFCQDGLWGAVGKDGSILISPVFSEKPIVFNAKAWRVRTTDKQGILNAIDLSPILPIEFDDIVPGGKNSLLYAQRDGLYAVFQPDGKRLTDFLFQNPPLFTGDVMKFLRDGEPWLLFSDGRCLSALEYEKELRKSQSSYLSDKILPASMKGEAGRSWQLPPSTTDRKSVV